MFKIVIDPGHGKNENKGVYPEYREGTQMWKLAQKIIAHLQGYECEVITTRPNIDDNPLPEERGKMAKDADLFLSLHSNTPSSSDKGKPSYEKATGTISFYSVKRPLDKTFAVRLAKLVADKMGIYSRGAQAKAKKNGEDWYSVIRNSIAVGCKHSFIIEHGFHSNKHDCSWLLNDKNLEILAEAESELITTYYNIKKIIPPKEEIEIGDLVRISDGAVYWNGAKVPKKYLEYDWYVIAMNHDTGRAVLGKSADGSKTLNSAIDEKYLTKVGADIPSTAERYPAALYNGSSIVAALKLIGADSSFSYRRKIAKANGINLYLGTSAQNKKLLDLLKKGELVKP